MAAKKKLTDAQIQGYKRNSDRLKPNPTTEENISFVTNALAMFDWEKPDMSNPAEVKARIVDYFKLCMEDNVRPSVEGMAMAFGVHRKTLWDWSRKNVTPTMPRECHALIQKAYAALNVLMADYMQNGKIHPVAGMFLMQNNMDYEDRRQVTFIPGAPLDDEVPAEELRQRYLSVIDEETP